MALCLLISCGYFVTNYPHIHIVVYIIKLYTSYAQLINKLIHNPC